MKKLIILTMFLTALFVMMFGGNKLNIYSKGKSVVRFLLTSIEELAFTTDETTLNVKQIAGSTTPFVLQDIDSLTVGDVADTITITYSETSASIVNPLQYSGVQITQTGADVVVTSTIAEENVVYLLKGSSSAGSLKIYSDLKFGLLFGGLTLTNTSGPAVNIQSSKRISVELKNGTTNTLTDGATYATSTEDQKAAFFSEGQLIFSGSGTLNVKSNSTHAICSDDYIQVSGGNINVTGAVKDGIHSKDYFKMDGGTATIVSSGDGIDCEKGHVFISGGTITATCPGTDVKGISADSTITVSGGNVNVTVNGNQSKGLRAKTSMNLRGGTIGLNTAGAAVLTAAYSGYDVSYCTGIKAGTDITLEGSTITIKSTGVAGKGISADGKITMSSGTVDITCSGAGATYTNIDGVADAYSAAGLDADGNISVLGGKLTTTVSGSASKGISCDGALTFGSANSVPEVTSINTGIKLLVSGTSNYITAVYAGPKAIKSDGVLTINNGKFTLSCSQPGAEGIDADSTLVMNGGTIGITMLGNQSKGIKSSYPMSLSAGAINIQTSGGVVLENVGAATYDPSYCTAIKSDATINIDGCTIVINSTGDGGKGISSAANINISSGLVNITTSGNGTTYTNASNIKDAYSAACISSDANVAVLASTLTCSSSGSGGKCIKANGTLTVGSTTASPTVTLTTTGAKFTVTSSGTGMSATADYCHPKTIVTDGAITINNGVNTISSTDDGIHSETSININGGSTVIPSSVEGVESLTITMNGGYLNVTASDDGINATQGTVYGGSETTDASYFYMNGGTLITTATSGDAVDSNGNFKMSGGVLLAFGPPNTTNEDIDVNGNIVVDGGILFGGCMTSNMFETLTSSSKQVGVNLKSTSAVSSVNGYIQFRDATGNDLGTFQTPRAYTYFHFSSPSLGLSTKYYIYTGTTYTGGTKQGNYCTGGTLTGTQTKTFTTSGSNISTISL